MTSAVLASSKKMLRPSPAFRLSFMLRTLRVPTVIPPPRPDCLPPRRPAAPPTSLILMTSAPRSASISEHIGPGPIQAISSSRTPSSIRLSFRFPDNQIACLLNHSRSAHIQAGAPRRPPPEECARKAVGFEHWTGAGKDAADRLARPLQSEVARSDAVGGWTTWTLWVLALPELRSAARL